MNTCTHPAGQRVIIGASKWCSLCGAYGDVDEKEWRAPSRKEVSTPLFDCATDARDDAVSFLTRRVIGALERRLEDKHGTGTEGDGAIRSMLLGLEAMLR